MYSFELGQKIHQLLVKNKLENPVDFTRINQWQDICVRQSITTKIKDMLVSLGLPNSLQTAQATAERLLKHYLDERFSGLDYHNFPHISLIENEFAYHDPLIAKDIAFISTCEHHLDSIKGTALIAYIPNTHLLGLNKLNQVLTFFANRPQLQERLTSQVFYTLQEILQTSDVAVVIKARHECMLSNGVTDHHTRHSSYHLAGKFELDQALKLQILANLAI